MGSEYRACRLTPSGAKGLSFVTSGGASQLLYNSRRCAGLLAFVKRFDVRGFVSSNSDTEGEIATRACSVPCFSHAELITLRVSAIPLETPVILDDMSFTDAIMLSKICDACEAT